MSSLEHLSDEDLLRLAEKEGVIQRKMTETPYEFSRESRGVGHHLKTLFGKVKKTYHRVKEYLPSADTVLSTADALALGGAVHTPTTGALYGASQIVRHIPKIGKHLAVPLAVAGVAPGAIKRGRAMMGGAGFMPPGIGMNRQPRYLPNAEVLVDGEWRVADRNGNVVRPAPLPQGSHNLRRPARY
jgi:hypothetical protein